MQGTMITIETNGAHEVQTFNDRAPTLEEMQAAVGGPVEYVASLDKYEGRHCVAMCHEEGKLEALPLNTEATKRWSDCLGIDVLDMPDVLVGPVIILMGDAQFMEAL